MAKPIPDNVKEILGQLSGPHQVVMRSYLATLRSEIKDLKEELLNATAEDPHAHFHGHEKCTADHSHAETAHGGDHAHKHEHGEGEHCDHPSHAHAHHHHDDEKPAAKEEHSHEHHEHHDHEHHHHDAHAHEHDHHEKEAEEMPAWKKKALESDPNAAPFGGSWNTESNVSASDASKGGKMEE